MSSFKTSIFPVVFCGILIAVSATGCKKSEPENEAADQLPIPVITKLIEKKVIARPVLCQGVVYPQQQQELFFRTGGKVAVRLVPEGRLVAAGDTLAALDLKSLKNNKFKARSRLNSARAELSEKKKLASAGLATKRDCDTLAARIELLKKAYRNAQQALSGGCLIAPQRGRLVKWFSAIGDSVTPGKPVALLTDPGPEAIARVGLSEADYHRLNAGDSAVVVALEEPNLLLKGVVKNKSISQQVTAQPFSADIYFENPGGVMGLGQRISATVLSQRKMALVLVPQDALVERELHSATVFLTDEEGKFALRRHVVLGPEVGQNIIIEKGLREGECLITHGIDQLRNGTRILTIAPPQPRASMPRE